MRLGILKSTSARLEDIEVELATMGGLAEQQLANAISAFESGPKELAESVIKQDEQVDALERLVCARCYQLLDEGRLTGAPLRRALCAMRVAAEVERVGDLAKNVAKRTIVISELDDSALSSSTRSVICEMGRRTLGQFVESLDCLFRGDAEAARAIRDADEQIDDLYNSIFREILTEMGQYGEGALVGTHLLFASKNFERIGDHATNIAERVYFSLTGDDINYDRPKSDITSSSIVAGGS